jgi:hypothetical protein
MRHLVMRGAIGWLAGLGLLAGGLGPASAADTTACAPVIQRATADSLRYDPFAPREIGGNLVIEIVNRGTEGCRLSLGIEAANGDRLQLRGPGGSIAYRLRPRRDGFDDGPGPYARNLDLSVAANGTVRVPLAIEIAPGIVVPPGPYGDLLQLRLFGRDGAAVSSEESVRLELEVIAQAHANIAGSAGHFGDGPTFGVIDFGTLETGERRRAILQIRANTEVRIRVRSEHGGELRHVRFPDLPGIPYSARFDGTPVDLAAVAELVRRPPQRLDGLGYPLDLTIGRVGDRFAGRYRDTLTVSIEPR